MEKDKGFVQWLKQLFFDSRDNHSNKKHSKYHYLLLVLAAGVAFMLISNLFIDNANSSQEEASVFKQNQAEDSPAFGSKNESQPEMMNDYEAKYESELKDALEKIVGVDDVTIEVFVDSTEAKIYEKDTVVQQQITNETDKNGGERLVEDSTKDEKLVIVRQGEEEIPIVTKTKKPEITGVLVIAKGADNIQVKKWLIEAVTRSLDVPSHRVSVLPKKSKEES